MVPRTTPAARPALDHEWLKASPFLVAHQTPDQDSLPKSYLESDTGPFGNPFCQQVLDTPVLFIRVKVLVYTFIGMGFWGAI